MATTPSPSINLDNMRTYTTNADLRYEPHTVTMSYADYQALPTSEKNNGKVYYIPDAPEGHFDDTIFSITETLKVGQTSLTFTDSRLTNDSVLDFVYPGITDVTFETFTQNSSTSFTLTFAERNTDLTVKAVVYNI